jgi:hypothetical protein
MLEAVPVARDEARAGTVDFEEGAEAVVLQLEEPIGVVERGAARHDERRDSWERAHRGRPSCRSRLRRLNIP